MRHLMRPSLTLLLLFVFGLSFGQDFTYPTIQKEAKTLSDFVPPQWTIRGRVLGDLNKDGLDDAAVVLQYSGKISVEQDGENKLVHPRMLLILFKDDSGSAYLLKEQSNSFILGHIPGMGYDRFDSMTINKGVLEISFQSHGISSASARLYKFRYQQEQFVLIGADFSHVNMFDESAFTYSYNFLTKKRKYTTSEKQGKAEWKRLDIPELKTLGSFRKALAWNIEKGVYL
jgi:hypothetical protein